MFATHLFSVFGRYLCRFRGTRIIDAWARYTDMFRRRLENVNFDMETNGERRVLNLLRIIEPHCVFDVGAHEGEWTRCMMNIHPRCTIHLFEPMPATFETLKRKTQHLAAHIKLNPFGLSEKSGAVKLHYSDRDSSTATLYPLKGMQYHDQYYASHVQCDLRKASDYIREHHIERIDFLKIDTEGADFQVIKGFGNDLHRVRVIQFEYGIFNISSHALLYDLCMYLKQKGFLVGKIYPKYVEFFHYHYSRENFLGNNYVAVRRDEEEFIQCLSTRRLKP